MANKAYGGPSRGGRGQGQAPNGLAFSCAVECLQLTDVPAALAERSTLARLALGTTFHAPDLLRYALGAAVWWLGHRLAARRAPAGVTQA